MSLFRPSGTRRDPEPEPRVSTRRTLSQHPLSTPRQPERLPYEPNPARFVVRKVERFRKRVGDGNYLLAVIHYPDCTNFEGNKILVFEDLGELELRGMTHIDPHFFNDGRYKTPIARFEPSNKGMKLARSFCEMAAQTT